ncbi:Histidinolphosphatase-like protein [Madurella fahalii]|uniref:Histidinolphosphatase-like protein n=1 Tax=Madurella fahalii TaxID=1157608 RepID=A0ABQ0G6Y9_9PEZI
MTTTTPLPTISNPPITLHLPSKYSPKDTTTTLQSPPLAFLHRTWTVTHSTLRMWRSARNVRITYGQLPASKDGRARVSDLVEYEALSGSGSIKRVAGVDTASRAGADTSVWDWRGSGLLFFVGSHWEVMGWGEREIPGAGGEVERWVVTWFAPTVFTAEGVDVYSDRREGGSEELVAAVMAELRRVAEGKGKLGELVSKEMREVVVSLPWKES